MNIALPQTFEQKKLALSIDMCPICTCELRRKKKNDSRIQFLRLVDRKTLESGPYHKVKNTLMANEKYDNRNCDKRSKVCESVTEDGRSAPFQLFSFNLCSFIIMHYRYVATKYEHFNKVNRVEERENKKL